MSEDNTRLRERLDHIGQLEQEHGIIGISFAIDPKKGVVTADDAAEYVEHFIAHAVSIVNNGENVSLSR